LLEAALGRPDMRVVTSFQSRFGRAKWLEPATDTTIEQEAAKGTRRMAVTMPGFSADCLETLEEIALEGRETFLAAGGEHYAALSCLNAGASGMELLEAIIRRELSGWI
jgi:ferrochelatase